jgi:flagellar biosynthesis/type III secretory pathway chaperone
MNQDERHRLEDVLDREIEVARLLAATLADERSALTGNSSEAVQQRTAEKMRHLETIEKLEQERRALGQAAGQDLARNGNNEFGILATVAERWRALMELMASCRAANEVNGYIIHLRQGQIRELIDIVRGGPPSLTVLKERPSPKRCVRWRGLEPCWYSVAAPTNP